MNPIIGIIWLSCMGINIISATMWVKMEIYPVAALFFGAAAICGILGVKFV